MPGTPSGSPADLRPGAAQHGESTAERALAGLERALAGLERALAGLERALAGLERAAMAPSVDQLPDELRRLIHLRPSGPRCRRP